MTEQSIGTARLDVVVGTDGLSAGIGTVQNSIRGLNADSQKQFDAMTKAQQRLAMGYVTTAQNAGKTREEIRALSAEMKIGGPLGKQLADNLRAAGQASQGLTKAFSGTNKTARELQFAMRGLPAQVTDIVTSLASGQRPLMVLLQQGGQLKDMFGGIGPAARAMGGAVMGLVNPFTIAAAAIVGVGLAFKQATDQSDAFNRALILSGNTADITSEQLRGMAAELDGTTGSTANKASAALAQVAATGKFTADQIALISEAALNLEDATGRAIENTVKEFAELKRDPVDAILKLNDAMGDGTNVTNFLTDAQIRAIEKFKEQGREAEAAALAVEAYADAINERSGQVIQELSSWAKLWRDIRHGAGEAGEAIANATRGASNFFAQSARNLLPFRAPEPELAPIHIGFKTGVNSTDLKARREAEKEFGRLVESNLSKQEKLETEIAKIRELGKKAGKDELEIQRQINQARARYNESLPKGRKGDGGIEAANSRAAIQALEDQLKKEQGLIQNQTRLLEANYAARNITAEKYYAEQKRLAQENNAAQIKALEGEIAALNARSLKGKDSINNARELAEKEALLAKVRADGATALEVLNIQEAAQIKQRQQANLAYSDALEQSKEALKAELDSQVLRISVGEREFEIRSRIIQLYRDEAKELLNLARQRDAGEIDQATYDLRAQQLKKAIAEEVKIVKDGYDAMAAAQANWQNGALKAFADYQDAANDVAGQTYSIFSNAISGLEDVFVDFFTKGKADWKGFFDAIAEDITRFVVRQQLSKLAAKFIPGMGEQGQGESAAALSGAAASLAASSAPLYGAAAALSASAAALAAAGAGSAAGGDSGGSTGSWLSLLGSFITSANADGNAFQGGNVVPFANGGIVQRPTLFPMRNGTGLMGEAGPEAILPLKRGPDGKLGVQLNGGNSNTTLNQTFVVQGTPDRRTREQMARSSGREARRGMARTGG